MYPIRSLRQFGSAFIVRKLNDFLVVVVVIAVVVVTPDRIVGTLSIPNIEASDMSSLLVLP